jgi:hypothetical protein
MSNSETDASNRENSHSTDVIERQLVDADADEYILAGELLGSKWALPEGNKVEIKTVSRVETSQQGETLYYPEVELWPSGIIHRVKGFKERIDPTDIGDIEPINPVAIKITERLARSGE